MTSTSSAGRRPGPFSSTRADGKRADPQRLRVRSFDAPYEVYGGPAEGWTETIDRRAFRPNAVGVKPDLHSADLNHEGLPFCGRRTKVRHTFQLFHRTITVLEGGRRSWTVLTLMCSASSQDCSAATINETVVRVPCSQAGCGAKNDTQRRITEVQPRQGGCVPREFRPPTPAIVGPTDRSLGK